MSTRSLSHIARSRPPQAGVAAGLAAGLAAAAGARFGLAALALCLPAALAVSAWFRHMGAQQAGLAHLAHLDPLTGLGNSRMLRQRLGYEIARHRRHQRQLALIVLDLDGFKAVNDRFGHPAGDDLLREVARHVKRHIREEDTAIRMGGDEFCVLAPETGFRDAERLAERLGYAVRDAADGLVGVSASIGYAVFPDEGATADQLLERADAAELDAKRRARLTRPQLRVAS